MGACKLLCRFSAWVVALLAIGVGVLLSPLPGHFGLWHYLDSKVDANGNARMKGISPAVHAGTPWGFTLDQLPDGSLKDKIFVVTGANVGLGYWNAHHLASKGGTVVVACRDMDKCTAAADTIDAATAKAGSLIPMVLDLSSFASIKAFASAFRAKFKNLHSLVLNAGIMMTPFGLTVDGIEQQVGVNHFGHFYLTQLLLPDLEKTGTATAPVTVVALSSSAHFNSYPEGVRLSLEALNDESTYSPKDAYGQSKLCNVLFAQELSARMQKKGAHVLVNSVHPGAVHTNLAHYLMDALYKRLPSVFHAPTNWCAEQVFSWLWTPEDAALTQVYAAAGPALIAAKTTGKFFCPIARETLSDRVHATNEKLQKGLWKLSEEIVASVTAKLK